MLIGIGMTTAMVLYEPALTVVVSWFDPARRSRAVLAVIVVAGFASTNFLPLTAVLVDRYGTLAYGTINGILATPVTIAKAVAPMGAAGLLAVTSYPAVLAAIGATCLVAAVGIAARAGTPPPVTKDGS